MSLVLIDPRSHDFSLPSPYFLHEKNNISNSNSIMQETFVRPTFYLNKLVEKFGVNKAQVSNCYNRIQEKHASFRDILSSTGFEPQPGRVKET